jgi:hypothetical protein
MKFLSSIRIVRVALALAVAFWMAGAGCMLGCGNMVSAAANSEAASPASSPTIIASGEVCASLHSHDCCAKHGGANRTASRGVKSQPPTSATAVMTELGATSSSLMDCPLAVNATAALSKAKQDQSSQALLLTRTNSPISLLPEQAAALSPPPRLPNRGQTYLCCCVFLI